MATSCWLLACAAEPSPEIEVPEPADLPFSGELPALLSELPLYESWEDQTPTPGVYVYEPSFPLWTNGSEKWRLVAAPDGKRPEPDALMEGTLFFKTFSYEGRRVETRVIRYESDGLTYGVYQWNAEQTDAVLLDGSESVQVEVRLGEESFEHEIPSHIKCVACHEASPSLVLGYNEAQLTGALPAWVRAEDHEVTGYVLGNCVHCHNGSGRQGASFDMRPERFFANTVNRAAASSASAAGLRVFPGNPEESVLFRGLSRQDSFAKAMPPLGVQRRDDAALGLFRDWIAALPPDANASAGGGSGAGGDSGAGGGAGEPGTGGTGGSVELPRGSFYFRNIPLSVPVSQVTSLRFIPGTAEFLLLTRTGTMQHFRLQGAGTSATWLGQVDVPGVYTETDCGLVSLAFDPAYATNRYIYLGHCVSNSFSAISRLVFDPQQPDYEAVGASAVELFRAGQPNAKAAWHNIGAIGFDAAGRLWAFFGDKTESSNGQDLGNELGALLRFSVGADGALRPAPDNPFIGDPSGSDFVYAYGMRSPWMGFIDAQGRYWIGDVGAAAFEEVNLIDEPGQNLGWATYEGPCRRDCEGFTQPVVYWNRDLDHPYVRADSEAVPSVLRVAWAGLQYLSSVDRYAGGLTGKTLYGDMCVGFVRAVALNSAGRMISDEHVAHLANATGWDIGPDGYIYASTFSDRCDTEPGASYGRGQLLRLERKP